MLICLNRGIYRQLICPRMCYAFINLSQQKCFYVFKKGVANTLAKVLDVSYNQAITILASQKGLQAIYADRIIAAQRMCKKMGITDKSILDNPGVLGILPVTIEQHTLILKESGFKKVDANILVNYRKLSKRGLSLLKAYDMLPHNADVVTNLISCTDVSVDKLPEAAMRIGDQHVLPLCTIQESTLRHYLVWRLGFTREELDQVFKTYPRLKHKSFRGITEAIQLLEEDLGFPKEKIRKNPFLIHSNAENAKALLEKVPSMAGIPIREVFLQYPKIIMSSVDTVLNTLNVLAEFGIGAEAIKRCFHIFTLGTNSVRERLEEIRRTPEFSVLASHQRILRLVFYHRKAAIRLQYLKEAQVRCASLHLLSSSKTIFERYVQEGVDKTRGREIVAYLSTALGALEEKVRSALQRHPFWCSVPLILVRETVIFLIKHHYSREDVFSCIQIVLYPQNKIEKELQQLPSRSELQPFSNWKNPRQVLHLVMYYLEAEHHFTGDGIWDNLSSSEKVHATAAQ